MKTAALLLLISSAVCFAGNKDKNKDKDELYRKGAEAALAFDSIAARDAFCAVAKIDADYKDATAQCQSYTVAAERILLRYKMDFAEGMSAMQNRDYDTAANKFKLVQQGEFAAQARGKLAEMDQLKAQTAKQRSTEFIEIMNVGSTAGSFKYVCGQNGEFEKAIGPDSMNTRAFFCAGWVRGVSDLLRAQQSKLAAKSFCLPVEASVGQQTSLLLAYIKDHPKDSDKPTSGVLDAALRKAYPCRAKKS
jgi:hypothetical protein